MPYITTDKRKRLVIEKSQPTCAGDLNFLFTLTADEYINDKGLSYATLNDVIGALECCKQELYRRVVSPYEDKKIKENGDVFTASI